VGNEGLITDENGVLTDLNEKLKTPMTKEFSTFTGWNDTPE
jgi:hypothetical protein